MNISVIPEDSLSAAPVSRRARPRMALAEDDMMDGVVDTVLRVDDGMSI